MMFKIFALSAKWAAKYLRWIFWEFLGIHFITNKLNQKNGNQPVVAGIWIIGIYIALFGLASQRYENAIALVDNRINITCLPTSGFKQAIARIPNTQGMLCPEAPELWNPIATIKSIFWLKKPYYNGVELLRQEIQHWKDSLGHVDLRKADLRGADLSEADLNGANLYLVDLRGANLRGADLSNACLRKADLDSVDLEGAKLEGADLRGAGLKAASLGVANLNETSLVGANLAGANLKGARFENADLSGTSFLHATLIEADLGQADLRGAEVTPDQLLTVASLYRTTLDRNLLMKVKEKYPEVLANRYHDSTNQWVVDTAILDQIKKPDWKGWH
jgi:hypothetical protein